MHKNIGDITETKQDSNIDMSANSQTDKPRIKKEKYRLIKHKTPIKNIVDIKTTKKKKYIYIKGKKRVNNNSLYSILKLSIVGFIVILLVNSLNIYGNSQNIQQQILKQSNEGYSFLIEAAKSTNSDGFSAAISSFEKANNSFQEAEGEIWFVGSDSTIYAKEGNVTFALKNLLESGQHFSHAGEHFVTAISEFKKIPVYFINNNNNNNEIQPSITKTLEDGLENVNLAINEINQASEKIDDIDTKLLPEEISDRFITAKETTTEISKTLNAISKHFPAVLKLLGDRYPHRVLVLLQNNYEVRPTGGFIGSYAIFDINDGYIENLRVEDVYDIDGSYGEYIPPPKSLDNFIDNWRFRDSNYSPDFPTSAKKARWFLEAEGGPSVDTVVAINQGILTDLLNITGPIKVGDFGELNSENYNLILSYVIEGKIWGSEDPKHILKIFVPLFQDAVLKEENISQLAYKLYKAFEQEHIVMYSVDSEIQDLFAYLKVDGAVHDIQQDEDYLSVINSSIGGNKSDQFIEQTINHHTHINKDGSIINTVNISRSHLWNDGIYDYWEGLLLKYNLSLSDFNNTLIDVLGRGTNVVNMQIYIPKGSILMSSTDSNIKTYHDDVLDRDYFITKVEVSPGEVSDITIEYKIPLVLIEENKVMTYKLFVDKQIGTRGSLLNKTISSDSKLRNIATYPEAQIITNEKVEYTTNLVYDRYFSGIWTRK